MKRFMYNGKRKLMIFLSFAMIVLGCIEGFTMLFVEDYEWLCFIGVIIEFTGIILLSKLIPRFSVSFGQNEKMIKLLKSSLSMQNYTDMQKIIEEYKLDGLESYQGSILKILFNASYTSRLVFCCWHYDGVKVFRSNFILYDEEERVSMCDYGYWISELDSSYYGGMDSALNDLKTELPAYPNEYPLADLKINLNTTYLTKIKWNDFKKTNIDIPFGSKNIFKVKIDGYDKIIDMNIFVTYWTGYCQSNAYIYSVEDDVPNVSSDTQFYVLKDNNVIAKGKVVSLSTPYFNYEKESDLKQIEPKI